jgi:hypothetical protein
MLKELDNILNFCNDKFVSCNRNLDIDEDFVLFSKYGNLSKYIKSLPFINNLVLINFMGNNVDINKTLEEHFIELPGSTDKVKLFKNTVQLQEE